MPEASLGTFSSLWLHDHHWEADEVEVTVAATSQNLGSVVSTGITLRIRVINIRHTGTNNTVVSILVGTTTKISIDVPPQSTRVWSSEHGIQFTAGQQPLVQSSNVTGGNTFVSAEGVEA